MVGKKTGIFKVKEPDLVPFWKQNEISTELIHELQNRP